MTNRLPCGMTDEQLDRVLGQIERAKTMVKEARTPSDVRKAARQLNQAGDEALSAIMERRV